MFVILMVGISLWVQVGSYYAEAQRSFIALSRSEIFVREAISHGVILLLLPLFPFILNRLSDDVFDWRRGIPVHLLGALVFTVLHVGLMNISRNILFPLVLEQDYAINLFSARHFGYEFRKDIYTYIALIFVFVVIRMANRRRMESEQALKIAKQSQQINLKSGGTVIKLKADEILTAKSAGNYAEVQTENKTHLARITLSQLTRLLTSAGNDHIRVHRSWIVNRLEVIEQKPDGEGGLTLHMRNGSQIPCSRKFRTHFN